VPLLLRRGLVFPNILKQFYQTEILLLYNSLFRGKMLQFVRIRDLLEQLYVLEEATWKSGWK
jgi:hypothetical protein